MAQELVLFRIVALGDWVFIKELIGEKFRLDYILYGNSLFSIIKLL